MSEQSILSISDLSVQARTPRGPVEILKGIDLHLGEREILGVVGESGSGKSTLVSAVLSLLGPNRSITGGEIHYAGRPVYSDGVDERIRLRGSEIGYVFQGAVSSLNPMRRVGNQLRELLLIHRGIRGAAAVEPMNDFLERLGFTDPPTIARAYPHQLSGGMAQRVAIAMALTGRPKLLLADECTSALDVSTQAMVVKLLQEFSVEYGYSMIFVTHDVALATDVCDGLAVLKDGELVERGPTEQVIRHPAHPYTRELIRAVPLPT